jgi:hypothetical protein
MITDWASAGCHNPGPKKNTSDTDKRRQSNDERIEKIITGYLPGRLFFLLADENSIDDSDNLIVKGRLRLDIKLNE